MSGKYLVAYRGGKLQTNKLVIFTINLTSHSISTLRVITTSQCSCMWQQNKMFRSNVLYDYITNTTIKTYSEIPEINNGYGFQWVYDKYLFRVVYDSSTSGGFVYVYNMEEGSTYPILNFITKLPVSRIDSGVSLNYSGSPITPESGTYVLYYSLYNGYHFNTLGINKNVLRANLYGHQLYNTLDSTVTADKVLDGYICYDASGKQVGIMPNNGALSYTPSSSQQTIPAGYTSGGTIAAVSMQSKTATPTTSSQTIEPDSGYAGLSQVTVNAVTSAIDNNIVAVNIKKDVSILGVTGTYEGSGGGTILDVGDNNISVSGTTLIFSNGGNE